MATFVYDKASGRMVDKATGRPMIDPDAEWYPVTPQVRGDIPPYVSPIDRKTVISGRAAKRAEMRAHGVVDRRDKYPAPKFRSAEFARKYGMPESMVE